MNDVLYFCYLNLNKKCFYLQEKKGKYWRKSGECGAIIQFRITSRVVELIILNYMIPKIMIIMILLMMV